MSVEKKHFWSAGFLIAGTCIGGGMLALPVDTGQAGFFPTFVTMAICWVFMTVTGLLLVEANLWMEEGTHTMTMASRLLGRAGKYASFILYFFMAYASLVAYTTGGSSLFQLTFGGSLSHEWGCVIFTLLFGSALYLGTKLLGRINAILFIAMISSYVLLLCVGLGEVKASLIVRENWKTAFGSVTILLTVFSYQMIVPSLTPYLRKNPALLRKAIILGTSIPFAIYAIWELIILGTIPFEGPYGLGAALEQGQGPTESLRHFVSNPWVSKIADFFAFFAIVTSYLGIALGLFDFISDSFKITKKGFRKFLLGIYVMVPSLIFAILFPKAFLFSLDITGGFGDAVLNGAMPALMVYSGRYIQKRTGSYQVMGGKATLLLVLLFALFVVGVQISKIATW